MPEELHPKHVANVAAMDPSALMTYFLSTVTDRELVYALSRGDRWVTYLDEDRGRSVFPVWAHPTFAGACATGDWADAEPDEVALDDWLDFLGTVQRDGGLVGVMMRPEGDVLLVEPDSHRTDLENFLDEPDLPG